MDVCRGQNVPLRTYSPLEEVSEYLSFMIRYDRKSIEKIISISIDYLDSLDGDSDFEQDNVEESDGDEGDYSYPEWRSVA